MHSYILYGNAVIVNGAPSHDTFNRVFQALDEQQLADSLSRWTQSVRTVLGGEVVALDGKSVRRALNRGEDFRIIVSAWATESGLLLGQRKVRDKSNEITVVPELLQALELGLLAFGASFGIFRMFFS